MNTTVMTSANTEIAASNAAMNTHKSVKSESVMSNDIMFFVKMSVLMAGAIVFLASAYVSVVTL